MIRKPAFNNPSFEKGKQTMLCNLKPKKEEELLDEETGEDAGNVVWAVALTNFVMLDVDDRSFNFVSDFADQYDKYHKLGSYQIEMSSKGVGQTDFEGNVQNNYFIIFGKYIHSFETVRWHVDEAKRLNVVSHDFSYLRKFGSITLRTGAKNKETHAPVTVKLVRNGSMEGIRHYLMHKKVTEGLGFLGDE